MDTPDPLGLAYALLLVGQYDCVDRVILNAYFGFACGPGGFRLCWRDLTGGDDALDNAHLMRMAGRFSRCVRGWAKKGNVAVIDCAARERKHDIAEEYFAGRSETNRIFLVLVNRAPASIWDVKRYGQATKRCRNRRRWAPRVWQASTWRLNRTLPEAMRKRRMLLVLGTRNHKKREEIAAILDGLGLTLGDLGDFPDAPEVVEDGLTFEANARKKASQLAKALGQWVLGEDSGLVVPALKGRPGIHSARFAGKHGDDEANNDRLLAELAPLPDDAREAYYVCTVAVADPGGEVRATAEGRCQGRITRQRQGSGGFGYDPLFLIPEYHQTFGELSPRVKHALSHRARALERLRPLLRQLIPVSSRPEAEGEV